jgi:Zn-finger nucleic acid-binding protein
MTAEAPAEIRCPRDNTALALGREHDIEVDACPQCGGAWYEDEELELLESTVAADHHRAGMIDYAKRDSELNCPICGERMRAFNYRAYNLELDACLNEHGFWLDRGEADHVRQVMRERVAGLTRAQTAERDWHRAKRGGGGGVLDQLRGLFRGGRR